jgi:hypothetical protein
MDASTAWTTYKSEPKAHTSAPASASSYATQYSCPVGEKGLTLLDEPGPTEVTFASLATNEINIDVTQLHDEVSAIAYVTTKGGVIAQKNLVLEITQPCTYTQSVSTYESVFDKVKNVDYYFGVQDITDLFSVSSPDCIIDKIIHSANSDMSSSTTEIDYPVQQGRCVRVADGSDGVPANLITLTSTTLAQCKTACSSDVRCKNIQLNNDGTTCEMWLNDQMKGSESNSDTANCYTKGNRLSSGV